MHHSRRTQRLFRMRNARAHETSLLSAALVEAIAALAIATPALATNTNYAQAQQVPAETSQPAKVSPPAPTTPSTAQAPTTPPAAQAPPPKAPPPETPAMILNGQQVESILGKKVRGTAGDDMGRIIDIIADKTGQVRAAIVDFGGFLGVGSRQIAVDWKAIRFPAEGKTDAVIVDLSKDQLRVAPVYKPGEQIVVLGQQPAGAPQAAPAPAPQATTDTANPVAKDPPSK
ncbi:sporulation protein YlmC with PRC-barrel domain [Nitrobacteraceae bacterium AZCC 1564]